jgi:hypothetical protein
MRSVEIAIPGRNDDTSRLALVDGARFDWPRQSLQSRCALIDASADFAAHYLEAAVIFLAVGDTLRSGGDGARSHGPPAIGANDEGPRRAERTSSNLALRSLRRKRSERACRSQPTWSILRCGSRIPMTRSLRVHQLRLAPCDRCDGHHVMLLLLRGIFSSSKQKPI